MHLPAAGLLLNSTSNPCDPRMLSLSVLTTALPAHTAPGGEERIDKKSTRNSHPSSTWLKTDQEGQEVTALIRGKRGTQPEGPAGIVELEIPGRDSPPLKTCWGTHGEEGVTALGASTE